MKRLLSLFLLIAFAASAFSQTPADTTLSIQNIDIEGKRLIGLSGGEFKRLQVDRSPSSATGVAAEAFRQIPSVITDIEGGITFRGANRAGLLLNGVPYGLLEEYSGDLLIQLPALFFNRISVASFPAIDRVPDGDAGLFNVASTDFSADDSPLQLTLGAGWNERYNAGAVINLHPGRFHIIGKYNYRREFRERTFSKSTTTAKNRTEMNNNASARPDVHLADLSIGYDLTKRDLLTVYGFYNRMDYSRYGRINNQVFNPKGEQMKHVIRNRYNDQLQEAYAAEARWKHDFSRPGERLDLVFNYNNFIYDEDNDFKNEHPESGKIVAEDNQFIRQEKHNFYWSAGYRTTFSQGWLLQAGYIGRAKQETYRTDAHNKTNGEWVSNPQKTNQYDFNRYLNLLYVSVEKQCGDFTWEAGVQGEFSRQEVDEEHNNRFHLYPRAQLKYDLHRAGHLSLSYMQRAVRPYGAALSPYVDYSDATHLLQGNPDLKDEFVHQLELSYRFDRPGFRLSPSLFYRNRRDRIMEIAYQQEEETIWKKENIGHSQTVGFELAASWTPLPILSIGFSGEVYRDEIDGRRVGYAEKKSLVSGDLKGDIRVHITPTTEFQVDAFYISDQLTPQGKIKAHSSVNAGLSQYFMNRKLRANVSVSNLFDNLGETTLIHTESLQMTQVRNRDARAAWVTLTYCL